MVLSQYDEPEYALGCSRDGAAGRAYLLKERVVDADAAGRTPSARWPRAAR